MKASDEHAGRATDARPATSDARVILAELPQPWVLKAPRFHLTLTRWLPVLAQYEPALLWIREDLAAVAESYRRRGEDVSRVGEKLRLCQVQFDRWPWVKLAIDAEGVAEAVGMFELALTRDAAYASRQD
jgi:hypothetical protein